MHTIRAMGAVTCPCGLRARPGGWRSRALRHPLARGGRGRGRRGVAAGGVGLAPLRSFVYHLLSNRERFGNVAILYGARTPADMLYPGELRAARPRRRPGGGDVDSPRQLARPRAWSRSSSSRRGRPGQGHRARLRARGDDATAAALEERGWPESGSTSRSNATCTARSACAATASSASTSSARRPVFPLPVVSR